MSKRSTAARSSASAHNLSVAPLEVRCEHLIAEREGGSHRCSRWFIVGPDGDTDRRCIAHSETEYAIDLRYKSRKQQQATFNAEAAHRQQVREDLLPDALRSFADIQTARLRLMRAVALEDISAAAGTVILRALDQATEHMRELGEPQALEGGSGYLRLLPGVKIVEQLTDANRPITGEEMRLLYERQLEDERNGRTPPVTWSESILLYLGIRREPEVAYDATTHEPIGEYRCEVFVNPTTRVRTARRMFVPYKSAELARQRMTDEAKRVRAGP